MSSDKYKKLAIKYHVDDVASSLIPGTSLSNLLCELETSKISNLSIRFLDKKQFLALESLAHGKINFDEYKLLAKEEKTKRFLEFEKSRQEREEREQKLQNELKEKYELQRKLERERQKKLEQDPRFIRKQKLKELKKKYDLDFYVEEPDYNRLMLIMEKIDKGYRISSLDYVWLSVNEEYFTDKLSKKYHKIEAEHFIKEYDSKNDHWLAVKASSHYRKAGEAQSAISTIAKIKLDSLKDKKLKSAICTTHGGALRDIGMWNDAIKLAETAHLYTPANFRPCTLLGALYMETSNYILGQEWYDKAIDRGFSEESVDKEIKSIFYKAEKSKKDSLRIFLLEKDPIRYQWVNQIIKKDKFK